MVRQELWDLGKTTLEVRHHPFFWWFPPIKVICCDYDIPDDIDLDHQAEVVFSRFFHFYFFSLSKQSSLKECHYVQPTLTGWKVMFRLFWGELFGILLQRRFHSSLAFNVWPKNVFTLLRTHGHLFSTLDYDPLLCYLFYCLNSSSLGHWEIMENCMKKQTLGTGCAHCY